MKTTTGALIATALLLTSLQPVVSSSPEPPGRAAAGALTYEIVVAHFREARFRATKIQQRCTIFSEGEWKQNDNYNYCLIMVENSDEDIQVTFYLTDAHEMNWVTEFLDAPFFAPRETERLFDLMNSGNEVRGTTVGRFRVDFHRWHPRHATILVFSFSPAR